MHALRDRLIEHLRELGRALGIHESAIDHFIASKLLLFATILALGLLAHPAHAGMIQLGAESAQFASPAPSNCSKVVHTNTTNTFTSIDCTSTASDAKFYLPMAIPPDLATAVFTEIYYSTTDTFSNRRCYWSAAIAVLRDGATAAQLDSSPALTAGPLATHVSGKRYFATNNVVPYDVVGAADCTGSTCVDAEAIVEITLRATPNTTASDCRFEYLTLRY